MPYYPMELLVLLGLGFFWPIKIMFALSFILSGLGMYFLAKEFFGKWGGVLSALFYVYAPYHSVDIYVRGAQNEAWGMVWFPFVLLYLYKLIAKKFSWSNFLLFALVLSGQLTSHNVMTLIFAPAALIWAAFWLWRTKNIKSIKNVFLSGILGIGLAAFFFFPVVLEQKYVHVDSMMSGYFNYMAHFADLKQLFISRFWGYGGSTWGPDDGMSFSVGQMQWIFALLSSFLAITSFRKNKSLSLCILMMVSFGFIYAFLTHSRSLPIWQKLTVLQYSQFPWRLVALIVFFFSFAVGFIATIKISQKLQIIIFSIISLVVIAWNMSFFHIERPARVTIEEKMAGRQWELQVTGGIFDYLPRSAPVPPGAPAFTQPIYIEGQGGILNFSSGTNWMSFEANVSSPSARIMLPLFSFPGLSTKVDGKKVTTTPDKDLGRVIFDLPSGIHTVTAKIGYTPVRLLSDIISLLSLFILLRLFVYARRHS
jgi:hypothetical protein